MFVATAWQALGSLLGLAGVIVAVALGASLPYLVLAVAVAPALALAGNGGELFFRRRPWLRPSLKRVDRDVAGALLRIGSLFFILQVAVAVAYESDALVLTQILGPSSVTTYSVTMRVFLVVPALVGFVLAPLWPAYGEAISRGDTPWVRQTLRRAVKGGLLLSISGAGLLVLVARPFIDSGRFSSAVPANRRGGDLGRRYDPWSRPGGVPQRRACDSSADRARAPHDDGEPWTLDRLHALDRGLRSHLGLNRLPARSRSDRLDRPHPARARSSRTARHAPLAQLTAPAVASRDADTGVAVGYVAAMPRIPLAAPDLSGNELAYVTDAIQSSWISSTGPYVERFEEEFARLCGTRFALSVCNGTAALHLALLALGAGPEDELIVPSLTYVATANAVRYVGAEPVFADVDPATWCLDPGGSQPP